jgi:porin
MKIANDLRNTIPALPRERVGLDHEQGVELFYNIAITPWLHVTPDLQFIDAGRNKAPILTAGGKSIGTAVVAGLRVRVDF